MTHEWTWLASFKVIDANLAKEPRDKVSEHNGIVGLLITFGSRDLELFPQICLPLVEAMV